MRIRAYRPDDLDSLMTLFRDTVRSIGLRDYSRAQVLAWAPDHLDRDVWARRLDANFSRVADSAWGATGFAEMNGEGYVDMLFVHKDRQGRGIASALLAELEAEARRRGLECLTTAASRTARPFFAARGFRQLASEVVTRGDQELQRFLMYKALSQAS